MHCVVHVLDRYYCMLNLINIYVIMRDGELYHGVDIYWY
jgi:hypothetical protein